MHDEMKVTAIAPWFGGKRTMATAIVAELGKHTQYFEPFCGSMAVLFAKPQSQKETVNDLHGDLINLARVLQHRVLAPKLYERLQTVVFSEGSLQDARAILDDPIEMSDDRIANLHRAYWYFLASWMGRNGTAGTARLDYQIAVRWTCSGGSPTVRFRNAVASIPAWHKRLLNVVVLRRDAFSFMHKFEDAAGTVVYIDPPYPDETRSSMEKAKGSGQYLHEFNHADADGDCMFGTEDDWTRLANIARKYKHARIVISSYDCPKVRRLFDGWTFIKHDALKLLHQQNGRGERQKAAPEVLIINGPSIAAGGSS